MKEVFLPITNLTYLRGEHGERGEVLRTEDDGTSTMLPAIRWPDGRVEIIEQEINDSPPSSGNIETPEFTDRELHILDMGLGGSGAHFKSELKVRRSTITEADLLAIFERRTESLLREIHELPDGHPRRRVARACLGMVELLRDDVRTLLLATDVGEAPEA